MAMTTALARERLKYYSVFTGVVWIVAPIVAIKTRNHAAVSPMFITGLLWAFQYDMAYGNMMERAQKEASLLMQQEPERFFMPSGNGLVSQEEYNKIVGLPTNYKEKPK